ncbi:MAG: purine-nucleoside phosphorylase [Nanoarchaeota archaeon]|nr:purine-nucleoside phosphorylase [Nanoarchaeota archaeon]MBU4352534.1 purine-nucleoside phosphorylase [Nanoarchaeota archaeon]MBU4456887.1 purine-nucleoside phosphorylase [Nanoarchaeota archaeon]MCG2719842.1 purine-nucleoside phosphorylase [Nanoarchaeota archaeon]
MEELINAYNYQKNYEAKVKKASDFLKDKLTTQPLFGLTLGSGLGELADRIENALILDYSEIPNFPTPTVEGHEGKMVFGELKGVPVIGLKGRKHFYEVADQPFNTGILQVAFPVHTLANLGVENYFATNAVGSLNTEYYLSKLEDMKHKVGDVMVIDSHINMIPNPLLGRHMDFKRIDGEKTFRFQPMNDAYDEDLRKILFQATHNYHRNCHRGTLLSLTGPTFESEAESKAFRCSLEADVVGMSVTPEVIVARNRGMKCLGMSCITNVIKEDGTNATSHEEVKAILESQEIKNRLFGIVERFFEIYKEKCMK